MWKSGQCLITFITWFFGSHCAQNNCKKWIRHFYWIYWRVVYNTLTISPPEKIAMQVLKLLINK